MKNILIFLFTMVNIALYAQTDVVYVTFNNNTTGAGIRHSAPQDYDIDIYRYPPHFFRLSVTKEGIYRTFFYANLNSQTDNPVTCKPVSFLETVDYIDWDEHTKGFTTKEYYSFIQYLGKCNMVYFIDRAEIKDGMMKMYPVKEMKSLY